jgi:hypothetical protein
MNTISATFSDGHVAIRRSRTLRYSHAWRFQFKRLGRQMGTTGFSGSREQAERELMKCRNAVVGVSIVCDEIVETTIKGGRV